jgi:hypothetical protein
MKKSIAILKGLSLEKGILSVLLTILFMAAAQIDGRAQVSSTTIGSSSPANAPANRVIYQMPTGSFVPVEAAQNRVFDAMKTQKEILAQNTPGSANYIAAERRLRYLTAVYENLSGGKGVAQSIADAVPAITMSATAGSAATPEEAQVERSYAINLLRP